MPNAEQFAEWITGDKNGLVSSDWRPSRLMLGEAVWTGTGVDLEYSGACSTNWDYPSGTAKRSKRRRMIFLLCT